MTWDEPRHQRETAGREFLQYFQSTEAGGLEGTKSWRQEWWKTIFNYTFNGPYFWTGRGFGINLAEADGFSGGDPTAPLRSPHSCHFTILARTGVPGLALWFLTLGTWSAMLLMNMLRARLAGDKVWADFFLLIFCYAMAFIIDGSFDRVAGGAGLGYLVLVFVRRRHRRDDDLPRIAAGQRAQARLGSSCPGCREHLIYVKPRVDLTSHPDTGASL